MPALGGGFCNFEEGKKRGQVGSEGFNLVGRGEEEEVSRRERVD